MKSLNVNGSYGYRDRWVFNASYFFTNGSSNSAFYSVTSPSGDQLTASPNTSGYVFEVDRLITQNLQATLQYKGFVKFNGLSSNIDGLGRSASDNNTMADRILRLLTPQPLLMATAVIVVLCPLIFAQKEWDAPRVVTWNCSGCHGIDGNAQLSYIPRLAGLNAAYAERRIAEFEAAPSTPVDELLYRSYLRRSVIVIDFQLTFSALHSV